MRRFDIDASDGPPWVETETGDYCRWVDVEPIIAERDKLQAERDKYKALYAAECAAAHATVKELQARVRELQMELAETRACSERFHAEARGCEKILEHHLNENVQLQARVRELEALNDRMLSEVAMNDVSGYLTRRLEALVGEE